MSSIDPLDNHRVEADHGHAEPLLAADWTPEEERRAKRKLDVIIMPLLVLGFYCLQLDRGT